MTCDSGGSTERRIWQGSMSGPATGRERYQHFEAISSNISNVGAVSDSGAQAP
jgi:hypothetical protein